MGLASSPIAITAARSVSTMTPNCKITTGLRTKNPTSNFLKGWFIQFNRKQSQSASLAKAMKEAAKPLVICGPSGSGKSSIVNKVTEEFPDCFGLSCSHTTRKQREGEIDGVHYYFVAKDEFLDAKERGEFIETAEFAGNMYGTSRGAINRLQMAGQICVLGIEMHGVHQIKKTPMSSM